MVIIAPNGDFCKALYAPNGDFYKVFYAPNRDFQPVLRCGCKGTIYFSPHQTKPPKYVY